MASRKNRFEVMRDKLIELQGDLHAMSDYEKRANPEFEEANTALYRARQAMEKLWMKDTRNKNK